MAGGLRERVKSLGQKVVPPAVIGLLRRHGRQGAATFEGRFDSFEAARTAAGRGGYEGDAATEPAIARAQRIRDAVSAAPARAYDAWTVQNLAAFGVGVPRSSDGRLRVLDFGGGMGVHFFTLRPFLKAYGDVEWTVCETEATARAGSAHFGGGPLRFVSSPAELTGPFDVVLTSGALQYLDAPAEMFDRLAKLSSVLILNRTPFIDGSDRLTVQTAFDGGRYPVWFLSERAWLARIEAAGFRVVMRWSAPDDTVVLDGASISYQGLVAKRG